MKRFTGISRQSWLYSILGCLLSLALIAGMLPQNIIAQSANPEINTPIVLQVDPPESTSTPSTPTSPIVNTLTPAADITDTSATLKCALIDLGSTDKIQVGFDYGEDITYGQTTVLEEMLTAGNFSVNVQGLKPATSYHYRAKAVTSTEEIYGEDATFTTLEPATPSPEPSPTETPSPAPTDTVEPTPTISPEPSPTDIPEPTPTETPEPTPEPTDTPTPTPTETPTPTDTPTPTPEPTDTPTPTPTVEPSPSPSETPTPTPTPTPSPSPIPVPSPSPLPVLTAPKGKVKVQIDPAADSEVISASGKIKLNVPQGAVTGPTDIEINELEPGYSTGKVMIREFDLNASDLSSGQNITQFNKALQISIKHDPVELAGLNPDSLRLYYLDDNTHQWLPVSSNQYNSQLNILTSTITHFSHYGEQADPLQVGPGRIMASQTDLHSGAATFNYPIDLPPGPGGFKPKIELTYNSGTVDEMKNKQATASWVGLGWNLKLGSISCVQQNTDSGVPINIYYLDLNGSSYQLASSDGTNYKTNPDQFYKITRSGNTWNLYDRDGNLYRFGGSTDSQQYTGGTSGTYYRWDLSLMQDTNGNQATVTYTQDIWNSNVRSAYPQYLNYGNIQVYFNANYDVNDQTYGYLRNDDPIPYGSTGTMPTVMDNRHLDSIAIKVNSTLVRQYNLGRSITAKVYSSDYGGIYYAGQFTLSSIQQVGADGTSTLPAMTFTYSTNPLRIYRDTTLSGETSYSGNPGNPATLSWYYLTTINSGYGGSVSFSYTETPSGNPQNTWTREIVTGKTITPGIGLNQVYTYSYPSGIQYLGRGWDQKYRGFGQIQETDAAGNYVIHYYYTTGVTDGKDGEKLTGREYKTQWYNSSAFKLEEKTYDWNWVNTDTNYSVINTWSGNGKGQGLLARYSYGLAIASDGSVYLTDHDSTGNTYHRVQKFDAHGNFLLTWGSYGTGDGQFKQPIGIALDSSGNVYVVDYGNNRVEKFTSSGTFLGWFGKGTSTTGWHAPGSGQTGVSGSGDGQFCNPAGIAIDSNNNIYVADDGNSRVEKFDSSCNFLGWFGKGTSTTGWHAPGSGQTGVAGSGNGEFTYPWGIAADSSNYLYVVDYGNNRVEKFNSSGTYQSQWGGSGSGNGQLSAPYGIAVDSNANSYVADTSNNRIEQFNSSGSYVYQWPLFYPTTEAVTANSLYSNWWFYSLNIMPVQEYLKNWTVQLTQVDDTLYNSTSGSKTARVRYAYDSYGNVITRYNDGDTSTSGDDSTIWKVFYPNTTANILDKPARERIYATIVASDDGGSNLKKETSFYYDGSYDPSTGTFSGNDTQTPTKGNLTCQDQKIDASTAVTTRHGYDSYGNKLAEKDPNNNLTKWTYDTTYHTYPATKTYPTVSGGTFSESYSYDPGTSNLSSQTDINSNVTNYYYDTFKRLTKTVKPGDTQASPSIQYVYNSWGTINSQNIETITKIDASHFLYQWDFFDGLGQTVQTQTQGETGHTIIVKTTSYNNRGLVDKQYVSQDIASVLSAYYTTGIANWKYTTYTYDGLGRVITQTNPDGTTLTNDYSTAWQNTITNERSLKNTYTYDAFGRLTQVQNQPGTTVVTNAASNVTSTTATLNGSLSAVGITGSATVSFEWGTTTSYGNTSAGTPSPRTSAGTFTASLSGLTANTTYHFRSKAVGDGTVYGIDQIFTTSSGSGSSTFGLNSGDSITIGSTLMNAQRFQNTVGSGTLTKLEVYVNNTPSSTLRLGVYADNSGSPGSLLLDAGAVTAVAGWTSISGLSLSVTANTYYWLTFLPSAGTDVSYQSTGQPANCHAMKTQTYGPLPASFGSASYNSTPFVMRATVSTSSGTAPSVATTAASGVTSSGATLNGNLTALGSAGSVTVSFEWGLTPAYGNTTSGQPKTSTGTFNANLTGLNSNTVYHFRAKAVGSGTVYGDDQTFTTSSFATATFGMDSAGMQFTKGGNYLDAMKFQNTVGTGTLTKLELLTNTTPSGKVRLGIFADNNGYPGSLLLDAGETNVVNGWVSISGLNLAVTSGTYYWLAYTLQNSNTIKEQDSSYPHYYIAYTYGALPDSFPGSASYNTGAYVMRATVASPAAPSTGATNYSYDILGNLIQVTDANGNITSMTYDWLSRKTSMLDPDMGAWYYGYDSNRNLTSQLDNKGQSIAMVYDALNRLINKNYPSGSGMTNVSYGYDSTSGGNYGKGKRTSLTDVLGANSDSWKYDTRGRLIREDKIIDAATYTTQYTYDGADRIYQITYPGGEVVTNVYNGRGLPYSLSGTLAGSLVTSTYYNALGSLTEINLNNGIKTSYGYYGTGGTYDTTGGYYGKLWEIKSVKSGYSPIQDTKYTWDAAGNLTQRQDLAVISETETFSYDYLDRLTSAATNSGTNPYSESYVYDLIGNILSKNGASYTYGVKPHAVTQVGSASYVYDANGNLMTRDTQTLTWDMDNHVSSVSGGASFVYDGDGNRVKKTEGGQTTVYIGKYYEKNVTSGEITTHYYLGTQQIAVRKVSTLSYLQQDALNSTSVISNTSGNSVGTMKYFSFGATRTSSGSLPTDQKFTGQRLDGTGLYYYNARYYDPNIGRFISVDTIVPNFTNPQSLNRYSYCHNNPLKYIDPTGHMDDSDLWIPDSTYYDYLDSYHYGFEESYSDWQSTGSPTVTKSGTNTTITISGQVRPIADVSTLRLIEMREQIETEYSENPVGSGAQGLAALENTIAGYEYYRSEGVMQISNFVATASFDSASGISTYNLNITCEYPYPQIYGYAPNISGIRMTQDVTISSLTKPTSSYSLNFFPSSSNGSSKNFDTRATINLVIDYGGAMNSSPTGCKIDFNLGRYDPYID